MRLFIAIQLNDEMKDALTRLQKQLQRQGVRGNFTRRENLHLTLAFIGEYPDPYDVKDIMEAIDFEPFDISLDGMGSFGSLWWMGLNSGGNGEENASGEGRDAGDELKILAKHLRHALADAGIPFDRKKFSPHITLVRKPTVRNGAAEAGAKPAIPEEVLADLPRASMLVDHISLMRSERGKHGMIYTEL